MLERKALNESCVFIRTHIPDDAAVSAGVLMVMQMTLFLSVRAACHTCTPKQGTERSLLPGVLLPATSGQRRKKELGCPWDCCTAHNQTHMVRVNLEVRRRTAQETITDSLTLEKTKKPSCSYVTTTTKLSRLQFWLRAV